MDTRRHPHAGQPVRRQGPVAAQARIAVVLVHGRGDSASDILTLADAFDLPDVMWLAPQAAGNTWYPYSFLAPIDENQPGLDSGLLVIDDLVRMLEQESIAAARVVLMGFSQGACLAQEYAARHARRYRAIVGLSGGLIGPPGTPRDYAGSLGGTPVFLGTSDPDPHIPFERVLETEAVLTRMGAKVEVRRYEGMGHTINDEEVGVCSEMLVEMVNDQAPMTNQ